MSSKYVFINNVDHLLMNCSVIDIIGESLIEVYPRYYLLFSTIISMARTTHICCENNWELLRIGDDIIRIYMASIQLKIQCENSWFHCP